MAESVTRSPRLRIRSGSIGPALWAVVWLASGVSAAAVLTCALIYSGYAHRGNVDAARFPQVTAGSTADTTTVGIEFDALDDHLSYSVILLQPGGPTAPLPPGLDSWPAPGEVALSPELRRVGLAQGIEERYGRAVHTIGSEGIGAPTERLAYVRPVNDRIDSGARIEASAFGLPAPVSPWRVGSSGAYFGESMNIASLRLFLPAAVIFMIVPALGCLVVVRRRIADRLGPRELLLEALGAPTSVRLRLRLGTVWAPIVSGVVLGAVLCAIPVMASWRLPFTHFLLFPELITDRPALMLGALGLVVAFPVGVLTTSPARRSGTNRPAQIVERAKGRWLLAGPLAIAGALWLPDLVDPGGGWVWAITYWLGVLATFAMVPMSIAILVTQGMGRLRRFARTQGWPAVLVPSAWLATAPLTTLRCAVTLVLASGLLFQGLVWTQGSNEHLEQALAAQEVVDGRILEVRATASDDFAEFVDSGLPEGVGFVGQVIAPDSSAQLIGSCVDLTALSVPCGGTTLAAQLPDPAGTALGYSFGDLPITGVVGSPVDEADEAGLEGFAFDRSLMATLDSEALQDAARATGATMTPLGQSWVGGATNEARQGEWIVLLGCLGLAAVLLALTADLGGRLQEHARRTGVLTALSGRARDHWIMAGVVAVVPTLTAGSLAYLAHAVAIQPFVSTPPGGTPPAEMVLPPFAVTCIGVALLSWLTVARTSLRAVHGWVPRGDAHL